MAQFTNQAQLRYGNSVTNSNIAIGEILEVLSVSKTAVTAAPTFSISGINVPAGGNAAADAASAVVITDTFDPILSNLTASYNKEAGNYSRPFLPYIHFSDINFLFSSLLICLMAYSRRIASSFVSNSS